MHQEFFVFLLILFGALLNRNYAVGCFALGVYYGYTVGRTRYALGLRYCVLRLIVRC